MNAALFTVGAAALAIGCGKSMLDVGDGGGAAGGSGGVVSDGGGGAIAAGGSGGGSGGRGGGAAGRSGGSDASSDRDGSGSDASAAIYAGCRFVGGIDRIVIAKRDVARNLCFNLVLATRTPPSVRPMLPAGWSVESASAGPLTMSCPSRGPFPVPAAADGSVDWPPGPTSPPDTVDADVVLLFGANDAGVPADERLTVTALDVTPGC